jgi:hypothetical protein
MNLPWTPAAGEAIGARWLLEAIAPAGAFGRAARERERAFRRGDEAAARVAIERVAGLAHALDGSRLAAIRAALAAPDPRPALARARAGAVLDDVDFFDVARFLDALDRIAELTDAAAFAGFDLPRPERSLAQTLGPGRGSPEAFYLDGAFDPALAGARAALERHQALYDAARSRLSARAAQYAGVERVRDGEFVLLRERVRDPLPKEIHVLREAPAYLLCELALDDDALEALRARDAAASQVAECEEIVRSRLSVEIAAAAPALERASESLGDLDLLIARVQFAQRYDCAVPAIADATAVALAGMRYLPLAQSLEERGRSYVPLTLELASMAVVTGPNMGGKTVALRTLGFAVACVALGLPVPAHAATLPLIDEVVWLGIGPAQDEETLLSAFGSEVVELRAFLARDARRALVLVDEFARTTSPREGRALLVALLETLGARGAFGLAATHLAHVARAAGVAHYASGGLRALPPRPPAPLPLERALERIASAMDYGLTRVDEQAESLSHAIELADALGLDPLLLARAREAL